MDERELNSHVKALQKALSGNEPAQNVITLMEQLKNNVNATEELLRASPSPFPFLIAHIPCGRKRACDNGLHD